MKQMLVAIVAVATLWAGYWFWQSNAQEQAIERWFDDRRHAGWAADYSDLNISGFPNRIDTTLNDLLLGDPATGVMWSAPFFQILRLSYNPGHVILILPNQQTLATPRTEVQVRSSDLRSSLRLSDTANWSPERFVVAAEDLDLQADSGWLFSAEKAQVSAERKSPGEDSFRVTFQANGVSGFLPNWVDIRTSTGADPVLDLFRADLDITLDRPLNRLAIEKGRPQLSKLDLRLAEADWNGLRLAMAGSLEVNSAGTPSGRLTLKIRNWRELLEQEAQAGRLSSAAFTQTEFALNLISQLSGNPETLDLPFDFKGGKVWLGPIVVGDTPVLRIP